MEPQTRQTALGVGGIVVVETVALMQGFNGPVLAASVVAIVALVSPEAVDKLPWSKT